MAGCFRVEDRNVLDEKNQGRGSRQATALMCRSVNIERLISHPDCVVIVAINAS